MSEEAFKGNPVAESYRLVDFDEVRIERWGFTGIPMLIVAGTAPCVNMKVTLSPYVYVMCPDWWGIEVVGQLPGGLCLPVIKPFVVSIPLVGLIGRHGIEVIGATRSEQIAQEGGCE